MNLFEAPLKPYGGDLLKTRRGRSQGRPLDTKNSMHVVLKSTKAKGRWSFLHGANPKRIEAIVKKFSQKYGIKILLSANAGNHLHLDIKLASRHTYAPFIRAVTGAIAMVVTGTHRWKPLKQEAKDRFWDRRPFSRVVIGWKAFLALKDYFELNKWEVWGVSRADARTIVAVNKVGESYWNSG